MPKRPLPPPGKLGECYLIHLDKPLGHARHYLGWSAARIARDSAHQAGNGARLLAVARSRGITFEMVRSWPGTDRRFERRLKNTANAATLCPVCNPDGWDRQLPEAGEPRRSPRKNHTSEQEN